MLTLGPCDKGRQRYRVCWSGRHWAGLTEQQVYAENGAYSWLLPAKPYHSASLHMNLCCAHLQSKGEGDAPTYRRKGAAGRCVCCHAKVRRRIQVILVVADSHSHAHSPGRHGVQDA